MKILGLSIHLLSTALFVIRLNAVAVMKKVYHSTVAIIPPEGSTAFQRLMDARYDLRDRGYYRWPPHINLIYPFVESSNYDLLISKLSDSVSSLQPFELDLIDFGVFGGKSRGVLWLKPVARGETNQIHVLQQQLQSVLPFTTENSNSGQGFVPHMTLSHFPTADDATAAATRLKASWDPLKFEVNEVFIMERIGQDGQFRIVWRVPLGGGPPQKEPDDRKISGMPEFEADWVKEAMLEHKRTSKQKSRGASPFDTRRPSTDTPEEMERKRLERASKKKKKTTASSSVPTHSVLPVETHPATPDDDAKAPVLTSSADWKQKLFTTFSLRASTFLVGAVQLKDVLLTKGRWLACIVASKVFGIKDMIVFRSAILWGSLGLLWKGKSDKDK